MNKVNLLNNLSLDLIILVKGNEEIDFLAQPLLGICLDFRGNKSLTRSCDEVETSFSCHFIFMGGV